MFTERLEYFFNLNYATSIMNSIHSENQNDSRLFLKIEKSGKGKRIKKKKIKYNINCVEFETPK